MPKTTTTNVNQNKHGQYQTTVPKQLANALELDGKELEWRIGSATDKLEVVIHE
jgi:hypothetical protein